VIGRDWTSTCGVKAVRLLVVPLTYITSTIGEMSITLLVPVSSPLPHEWCSPLLVKLPHCG
jgi:hypothetical protein